MHSERIQTTRNSCGSIHCEMNLQITLKYIASFRQKSTVIGLSSCTVTLAQSAMHLVKQVKD
jgi:hypothetical protein